MSAPGAHPALTQAAFISQLQHRLASPAPLGPGTRLTDLPQDRASRAFLLRCLSGLLADPPMALLRSIETVGEAYQWYLQRQDQPDTGGGPGIDRVVLRPIEPEDHWALYLAATRPDSAFRWRYRGATPGFERFVAGLHDGVLVQHVVQAIDGPPVGLVVCYQASMESRSAYFGFVRTAATSQEGRMFEGLMLFLRFLFETWDLRKLYAEVPAFNFDGILSETTRGIEVEGVQRGHLFHDGRWWDQYLLALWRERWETESAAWFDPGVGDGPD